MTRLPTLLAALLAVAVFPACSSSSTSPSASTSAETACDPLATHPTTLATILGVGKDGAGTLYVADQGAFATQPSIVRVFLTSSGSLVRQYVIGSGSASGQDIETFESPDGSVGPRDLTIALAGTTATSMTLGPEGSAKSRIEGLERARRRRSCSSDRPACKPCRRSISPAS